MHNWAHKNASLVRRRFSTLCLSSILRICPIAMNSKSENRCFSLLKWTAISQLVFFAETEEWLLQEMKQMLLRIKIVPGRPIISEEDYLSHKKFLKNRSGNDKNLKAAVCKYREFAVKTEISKFFIFSQKKTFGETFSKITIKVSKEKTGKKWNAAPRHIVAGQNLWIIPFSKPSGRKMVQGNKFIFGR